MAGLGDVDSVLARYLAFTTMKGAVAPMASVNGGPTAPAGEALAKPIGAHGYRYGSQRGHVIGAVVLNQWNAEVSTANPGTLLTIRISVVAHEVIPQPLVGFLVRNTKGETIFGTNTTRDGVVLDALAAGAAVSCDFTFSLPELYPGPYGISVALSEGTLENFNVCDYVENCLSLTIEGNPADVRGYLRLGCQASVRNA